MREGRSTVSLCAAAKLPTLAVQTVGAYWHISDSFDFVGRKILKLQKKHVKSKSVVSPGGV